jgi:Putative lumazine-binding
LVLASAVAGCASIARTHSESRTHSPEQKEVIAPLQGMLDGLAARDRNMIAAQLLPGGSVVLVRNGKPVQMAFDTFAERLSTPGTDTRQERIYDPVVHIDNDIASIWTRYDFVLNGKIDHCGTDSAGLVKVDGRWLIAFLSDTSRSDCGK